MIFAAGEIRRHSYDAVFNYYLNIRLEPLSCMGIIIWYNRITMCQGAYYHISGGIYEYWINY